MRINRYIALATGLSRRAADEALQRGRILVNDRPAEHGQEVSENDEVKLDNRIISSDVKSVTILLHKPQGFICSRAGQGGQTVYDLLPQKFHSLKPVGRLDKNSSGLLLLTNDGELANKLTHPKYEKTKVYKIALNKPLTALDRQRISGPGVMLDDGLSKLHLERINSTDNSNWKVTMNEGRNRQIRRSFEVLGYSLPKLHRTKFGTYELGNLMPGKFMEIET